MYTTLATCELQASVDTDDCGPEVGYTEFYEHFYSMSTRLGYVRIPWMVTSKEPKRKVGNVKR